MNYQQIKLDEYSLSGAGGTALTYTHKQEKRLASFDDIIGWPICKL